MTARPTRRLRNSWKRRPCLAAEIRDAADAGALRVEVRKGFENCLEAIRSLAAIHKLSSGKSSPDHLEESVKRLSDTVDAALANDRLSPEALRRMTAILAESPRPRPPTGRRVFWRKGPARRAKAHLAGKSRQATSNEIRRKKADSEDRKAEAGGGKADIAVADRPAAKATCPEENLQTPTRV